ncbi:MAG: hypothetical protein DBX59_10765 [Bacillota bacterium]|nr:MAG: hypothetical protein DBX59_10765 [Bacillota bacterium]
MKVKIKALILALVLAVTACGFAACDRGNEGGGADEYGNMRGSLNIMMFDGGYGIDFMKSIAAKYAKKNPRVKIKVSGTVTPSSEIALIESHTASNDLYFMIDNMCKQVDLENLLDISEVYDYVGPEQEKPLKERMNSAYVDACRANDGKFYLLPWSNSQEGLVYNKTVMDEYFPNLQLPRTTEEMFETLDTVKANSNVYAFCYSGKNDYLPYLFLPWWAQYEGLDAYWDYYEGYYRNESGERVFSKHAEVVDQAGRLKALEVLERLCKKSNGYQHRYTEDMDFMKMQLAFLGHGYNQDEKPSLFSINGEWLENEMDFALEEKPQDIRFMKLPVLSAVIDKTPSIEDDATLRAVVDYCDGVSATLPDGVTAEDAAYIDSCRRMTSSVAQDHTVGVYSQSRAKELAIDFLKFLTTKEAGETYSNYFNGLTLPYGAYDSVTDDASITPFLKSRFETKENCIPIFQKRTPVLVYRGGLAAYREKFGVKIFTGELTAAQLVDKDNYFHDNWSQMVRQSGLGSLL